MGKRIVGILVLCFGLMISAQAYWQQEVGYEMHVSLDGPEKLLTARSHLTYINHSPDSLAVIYMHLMPNAFNWGTLLQQNWALAGYTFPKGDDWTGIEVKRILRGDRKLPHRIQDDTILRIDLDQPIGPGDTLRYRLDWTFKVHQHMDRSGWRGEQFDFAQWYPKFVVYDENGWHLDPFADYGEFYGEFGTFDVTIDLPASHIVGATGVVTAGDPGWEAVRVDTSRSWLDWLQAFSFERDSMLAELDSTARRSVTFHAEQVHDFAWLTSPRLVYESSSWDSINVHVLYDIGVGEAWTRHVARVGAEVIRFHSEHFGRYKYPQMTITKALMGGGMEYPMLVMNGSEADNLIAHEVAHNWFYGAFGSDELDEAWLDEGLTSFAEEWYIQEHFADGAYRLDRKRITPFEYESLPRVSELERSKQYVYGRMLSTRDDPIGTASPFFRHAGSYYANVYDKATLMLTSLRAYLGEERYLAGIRLYYDRWALKHVNGKRFIRCMEQATGEDLDWFFDQWLHTTGWVDYHLRGWKVAEADSGFTTTIRISKDGYYHAPVPIELRGDAGERMTTRLDPFVFQEAPTLTVTTPFKPTQVTIDPTDIFLDVDRRNNGSRWARDWAYDFRGLHQYPGDATSMRIKPLLGHVNDQGVKAGLSLRTTYRGLFDETRTRLWFDSEHSKLDWDFSLEHPLYGRPIPATLAFKAGSWAEMEYAEGEWSLRWNRGWGYRPETQLRLGVDYTALPVAGATARTFSRFKTSWTYSGRIRKAVMDADLTVRAAPAELGNWGDPFTEVLLQSTWWRSVKDWDLQLRGRGAMVSATAPAEVIPRLSGPAQRDLLLDRFYGGLVNTSFLSDLEQHYRSLHDLGFHTPTAQSIAARQLWSLSLDVSQDISLADPWHKLTPMWYLDLGQTCSDVNAYGNWRTRGASGLAVAWEPYWKRTSWLTSLVRPFRLELVLPMVNGLENSDGLELEMAQPGNQWAFSLTFTE